MFEDHGGQNKTRAEAQKDRIVYFGCNHRTAGGESDLAPPSIIPPLSTLDSTSPPHLASLHHLPVLSRASSSPSLSHCFITSSLCHLSPALFLILLSSSRLSFPSFSPSFVAPVSLYSFRMMGCCLSGCGKEGCREQAASYI